MTYQMRQFPQRDEAVMAQTHSADINGSASPTGEAEQQFGSKEGTLIEADSLDGSSNPTGDVESVGDVTYTADFVPEAKVVDAPAKPAAKKSAAKAEKK